MTMNRLTKSRPSLVTRDDLLQTAQAVHDEVRAAMEDRLRVSESELASKITMAIEERVSELVDKRIKSDFGKAMMDGRMASEIAIRATALESSMDGRIASELSMRTAAVDKKNEERIANLQKAYEERIIFLQKAYEESLGKRLGEVENAYNKSLEERQKDLCDLIAQRITGLEKHYDEQVISMRQLHSDTAGRYDAKALEVFHSQAALESRQEERASSLAALHKSLETLVETRVSALEKTFADFTVKATENGIALQEENKKAWSGTEQSLTSTMETMIARMADLETKYINHSKELEDRYNEKTKTLQDFYASTTESLRGLLKDLKVEVLPPPPRKKKFSYDQYGRPDEVFERDIKDE